MESLCNFINVSDLHWENILYSNSTQANARIYLIDLESIQPGARTGLFTRPPRRLKLSEKEQAILEDFNRQIDQICYRFIPILRTWFLGGLSKRDSFVEIAEEVSQGIKSLGCSIRIQKVELE